MPSNPHESEAPPATSPPAEARLIRRAREASGLSYDQAAQRLKIKLSGRRWRQLEEGREHSGGKPATMGDATLAHMAHIVGVTPEQLLAVSREEAAEILREIERQERKLADSREAVAPRAEVPSYVDLEHAEDWEVEIWEQLTLTDEVDKGLAIQFLKGIRASRAVDAGAGASATGRRAG